MRLADLRWWTVLLPALVIMGVDQARHQLVLGFSHSWWEQGLLLAGVLFATVASSQVLLQRVRAAQRREREAEALRRIGIEATSSLNLADIVDSILAKGREVLDVNCLGVSLYGSEAGELVLRTRDSERSFRTRVPGQVALAAGGASNDEPLEIIRGSTHQDAHLCGSNCRRCLIVPLKMGTESLGLLCAGNPSLRAFDGEKRQLALQIAALASAAVASGLLHERSRSVAITFLTLKAYQVTPTTVVTLISTQPAIAKQAPVAQERKLTAAQEAGRRLYQSQNCASCHKIGGSGGEVGPPLDGVGSRRAPAWLHEYLETPKELNPNAMMPGFLPPLSHQKVEWLAQYLAALR